ncbi:MAG: SAM hydrolase/SAM-dependent halogenase family protein, partial [Planctomycetota bacterium]
MAKRKLVTLLTDFGTDGPYVPAMKGALLSACGDADIVDISHDIPAQDVVSAGLVLAQSAPWFPPGTLHVVVVDPTVGTDRPLLYAQFGRWRFLFPDNGVITFVAASLPLEVVRLCVNSEYVPSKPPSNTFHGRDV